MLHLIWYFLDKLNNDNQNPAECFPHKNERGCADYLILVHQIECVKYRAVGTV